MIIDYLSLYIEHIHPCLYFRMILMLKETVTKCSTLIPGAYFCYVCMCVHIGIQGKLMTHVSNDVISPVVYICIY